MSQYFENLNGTLKEYFKVLSDEIPDFLYDYIDTPEMQRIGKIGNALPFLAPPISFNKIDYL